MAALILYGTLKPSSCVHTNQMGDWMDTKVKKINRSHRDTDNIISLNTPKISAYGDKGAKKKRKPLAASSNPVLLLSLQTTYPTPASAYSVSQVTGAWRHLFPLR